MRKLIQLAVLGALFLYPFIIYFGFHFLSIQSLSLIVIVLLGFRFMALRNSALTTKYTKIAFIALIFIGIICAGISFFISDVFFIKLYPILMNVGFFILFSSSLFTAENIILRVAKKTAKSPLPKAAVGYTKKVTVVWCVFFIINALISLVTALFFSITIWTIYNGFISYLLIAIVMLTEIGVRQRVKKAK